MADLSEETGTKMPVINRGQLAQDIRMRLGAIIMLLVGAAIAGQLIFYWPGYMIADSTDQLMQARTGAYSDWHPPIYALIWHLFLPLWDGPQPMLLVQLALYWAAFLVLAATAFRQRQPILGLALVLCAFEPVVFLTMGWVVKDTLMTALFTMAVALYAQTLAGASRRWLFVALICLLVASALRFNSFVAAAPLGVAFLPDSWRNTPPKLLLALLLVAIPFASSGPIINHLVQPRKTGVERSLILFDLGGITEHSSEVVIPPVPGIDVRVENHRCYTPIEWDNYAWGLEPPCKINPKTFETSVKATGKTAPRLWLDAVVRHPFAYAEHRLSFYNRNIRWFVLRNVNKRAYTPFGWPVLFVAIAAGALILSWRRASQAFVFPVATSSIFYSLGYVVSGVASDLRYNLWTIIGALIAATVAAYEFFASNSTDRERFVWALAPVTIAFMSAIAWRLFAWLVLRQ